MRINDLIMMLEELRDKAGNVEIVVHDPYQIFSGEMELIEEDAGLFSLTYKEKD